MRLIYDHIEAEPEAGSHGYFIDEIDEAGEVVGHWGGVYYDRDYSAWVFESNSGWESTLPMLEDLCGFMAQLEEPDELA